MKKFLTLLFLILNLSFCILFSPNTVLAQIDDDVSQQPPSADMLDELNPIKKFADPIAKNELAPGGEISPASIINRALTFLFPISGFILFIMIVWGGFEMLGTAATKKSMDAGRQRITAALIGFFILFMSYWIIKIIEAVFGVKIF